MFGRMFGSKTPPPASPPASAVAKAQSAERAENSRNATRRQQTADTASKLATIVAVAGVTAAVAKNIPLVGGAIAGVIMVIRKGVEAKVVRDQIRALAQDIVHDLTYSYLLFKMIDIASDKLGIALDIEIIQEGIKDINEKVNKQLAPKPGFTNPFANPSIDLTALHDSLRVFRNNMNELYTSYDVLKKNNELLVTLEAGTIGKRYPNVTQENINILVGHFTTVAGRELTNEETGEVMVFMEKAFMSPMEKSAQDQVENGGSPVPDPDAPSQGGALWPPKYYRGLSTRRKGQRRREITRRAKMSYKNPAAYRPFATDRNTKRRPSSYTSRFHSKYPGVTGLPAIAKATGVPMSVLEKVYDRGLAAWRTGHRPGASQHAWGMARVYSFVLHGKTWRTADADLARRNSSH